MLKKATLATVVYYDILSYPLTEFEVWKHLIQPNERADDKPIPTLAEVSGTVDSLVAEGKISRFRGFIMLPGKESLIFARIHEEKRAVRKIRRAARLIRFLAWAPYVRMIGLTGSLSMKQGDQGSDWDFFVVLRKGAIWRGRTWLVFMLQMIGKRRHGRHVENRACLNHFVTDASLEISMQDFFSAHEYRFMYPITGWQTYRKFELANRWIARIKPTFTLTEIAPQWLSQPPLLFFRLQSLLERCLESQVIERTLAYWQKRKIAKNPKTHKEGAFIVANEEALIFLPSPKGPMIFEKYKQALSLS